MDLGRLIREIRKSRGETLKEFAEFAGVRYNTVSQYETGKAKPSTAVLFRLHDLARTPVQRLAIRDALGSVGEQLRTREETANEERAAQLLVVFDGFDESSASQERFQELCVEVSRGGDVPLWMLNLLESWLVVKDDPTARPRAEDMFVSFSRAMVTLGEAAKLLSKGRD